MRIPTLILALALAGAAPAQDIEINLVAGESGGTSRRIGQDIAAAAAECGLAMSVRETAGAIENFLAVRSRRLTQFGMVQGDVLEYYLTYQADDEQIRNAAHGMRIVFPLQNEEIHLLARREIADLADLAGRRVAVGAEQSGTSVTAALVLDLAQVAPGERLALGPAEALEALLAGEIDALFFVAGAPAPLFAEAAINPSRFHLLPLADPILQSLYTPIRLEGGTYAFQPEPLDVVAVRTYLVTYDFVPGRNSYQAGACRAVADVSNLVASRLDRLREAGHPSWRTVDLTALPAGWTVSDCTLEGLSPGYPLTCAQPDGTAIEADAAEGAPPPNRLYLERICASVGC